MSEQNVAHQWKCEPRETSASSGNCNYFGKSSNMPGTSAEAPSTSSAVIAAATSAFTISGHPNLSVEMYALPLQHHAQQPQTHLELQKLSNFSKINTLTKITGLEGVAHMPEDEKLRRVHQIIEAGIGDNSKQQILQILDKISLLKPPERLLLYLRMPGGTPETDPLRQPQNPLGTRSEINHTINWVRSHLEHDPKVSIPKQDVYNDYIAYCERVDIKPLSTADFGKVMKQVFPEIRPRRLGTRGHSRYCYAAMRKATKLELPHLPSLGVSAQSADFNGVMDEDSWKIIKLWAEGLLNANFDTLKDLATHITRHHLNTPASNSSRVLLQKKLLQREMKEKRKFAHDVSPLKKRRKKKRRSSSSSESAPQQSAVLLPDNTLINVKEEMMDTTQQPQPPQVQQSISTMQSTPKQQLRPMNLVTENDACKTQGTNIGCDNNLVPGCVTKSVVPQNIISAYTPTSNINIIPQNVMKQSTVKEELPDEYNANVLCKKVRQAQQAKGLWNPPQHTFTEAHSLISQPGSEQHSGIVNYSRINEGVMGPPTQIDSILDISENASGKTINQDVTALHSNKSSSPLQLRTRKLRYLQTKLENLQEEQVEVDSEVGDKDVLPENLGIPRERVISICNMDKHELDDYLNEEDNSQDQEAELLQYFQSETATTDKAISSAGENIDTNALSTSNAFPTVENYHTVDNNKEENKPSTQKDQDEITQLRYYLHQNLQTNKDMDISNCNKPSVGQSTSFSGIYTGASASASLVMMSQRHLEEINNLRCCNNPSSEAVLTSNENNSALRGPRRKINLNARSCVPNSPNARRKNFSFVPISPNINTPNNSVDYSPFVSPRSTPVIRKPPLHKQQSLPLSDTNLTDPMLSTSRNSFSKAPNINMISASAPPSPSLVQQRFHFAAANTTLNVSHTNGVDSQFNHFQSVAIQCRGQNSGEAMAEGMGESRSQSVPLHCRSPNLNQSISFQGFSSACSSVAQTPVPPEFVDFTDPSSILDIFSDTSQHHPIKLETNSILDDITSNESGIRINDILTHEFDPKINSSSRSVPVTPLPMINYKIRETNTNIMEPNKTNKVCDISKSVPTTPIAMNVGQFRYSPEFNRDFLINGNTIETSGISSNNYYNQQQQQTTRVQAPLLSNTNDSDKVAVPTSSLTEGMEDLPNFGEVGEPIIGADLLANL